MMKKLIESMIERDRICTFHAQARMSCQ
jgi:hypothetical protein